MGIDYIIHYDCVPKRAFTVEGLMGRLKGRDRARAVIQLYRDHGDQRPPSKMGFEMVRRLPDGTEETEIIIVQDLLDVAAELEPYETYCVDCPANHAAMAFGCIGTINYPISAQAERWLLDQLPGNDHPLAFMLLQKAIYDIGYSGEAGSRLRTQEGVFLESVVPLERDLDGVRFSGDQVFEMLFLSGPIQPAHGSMLLQFFGGISPDLEADEIMQLAAPPSWEWIIQHIPFRHSYSSSDDVSTAELKAFFHALYVAYKLGEPVLLDI